MIKVFLIVTEACHIMQDMEHFIVVDLLQKWWLVGLVYIQLFLLHFSKFAVSLRCWQTNVQCHRLRC